MKRRKETLIQTSGVSLNDTILEGSTSKKFPDRRQLSPSLFTRDFSLTSPDGPLVRAIDTEGNLTTKPEDLVKIGYDLFGFQSDIPASAIIVMCLLWQPDSIKTILENASSREVFKNMVTIKDVLNLANYLPPSFTSKIITLFTSKGFSLSRKG